MAHVTTGEVPVTHGQHPCFIHLLKCAGECPGLCGTTDGVCSDRGRGTSIATNIDRHKLKRGFLTIFQQKEFKFLDFLNVYIHSRFVLYGDVSVEM